MPGSRSSMVRGFTFGTVARGSHAGRWRTGTRLPGCCGLMAAMCVLGTERSLRRLTACDVVVGTSCIMQRRWFDSGYRFASAPGCLCRIVLPFYAKGKSDPEVVSVLFPGVMVCESRSRRSAHSWRFSCLRSWWSHEEIGHYVYEPLVSGSSCSLSGVLFMTQCLVQQWVDALRQLLCFGRFSL